MTAHKYLGLTREVVRTEQAINDLACYPLPPAFWETGGIQRLRARFVPETKLDGPYDTDSKGGPGRKVSQDDYFGPRRSSTEQRGGSGKSGGRVQAGSGGKTSTKRSNMPLVTPYAGPRMGEVFWDEVNMDHSSDEGVRLRYRAPASAALHASPGTRRRSFGSTTPAGKAAPALRKVGDLWTMSSVAPSSSMPPLQTPRLERTRTERTEDGGDRDFDLRDAVMECISKAIGLVQPHVTPSPSVEASPVVRPSDRPGSATGSLRDQAAFNSSFGSLSILGLQGLNDDDSSISSMSGLRNADAGAVGSFTSMDLENEVEILYFPQGSVLVKEGERNAGLYFVIEGFLDVSMPEVQPGLASGTAGESADTSSDRGRKAGSANGAPTGSKRSGSRTKSGPTQTTKTTRGQTGTGATGPRTTRKPTPFAGGDGTPPTTPPKAKSIPLFTVRPGGIAGYLSSLSGFPSYVDITAKTECYVGFLPAKALERIMDRKPIVLLTLAKRLISLLSPLGELAHCVSGTRAWQLSADITSATRQCCTSIRLSTGCTSALDRSSTDRTLLPIPSTSSSTDVCVRSPTDKAAASRCRRSMVRASQSASWTASHRHLVRRPCTRSAIPSWLACR